MFKGLIWFGLAKYTLNESLKMHVLKTSSMPYKLYHTGGIFESHLDVKDW